MLITKTFQEIYTKYLNNELKIYSTPVSNPILQKLIQGVLASKSVEEKYKKMIR